MNVKAGYKTTEFWLSVLAALIGFLVLSGAVPGLDQPTGDALVDAITQIVEGVVALVAIVAPLLSYINSRADVKASAALAGEEKPESVG